MEYSDPSELYPSISSHLHQRLPLRNLHWNSASRPLRSISSLHVEFVSDNRHLSRGTTPWTSLEDASQVKPNGTKERRHQIPGLRQTPYLKIYLLSCDDLETYKTISKKLLRDWVKNHAPLQSGTAINKAENHDAFEWLIVHVILPIKDGQSGSRVSGSSRGDSHSGNNSSTSRSSARNLSSIIERIRSDFNGSSKSAIDRVAQIQIGEDIDLAPSLDQHLTEDQKGFADFVSKLKYLILASFDRRVNQYEEDIKEKDSQRNLPGWNFNTFFVLKEGLARGFESVGLLEDALTSYYELYLSLKTIISQQESQHSIEGQTDLFREYTDELLEEYTQAANSFRNGQDADDATKVRPPGDRNAENYPYNLGSAILDTNRKPYRELILENNVSAFEFLCYVFARRVSLLLRLANATSVATHCLVADQTHHLSSEVPNGSEKENMVVLADVCYYAVDFITSVTSTIRADLRRIIRLAEPPLDEDISQEIIENLVSSWVYYAAQRVLEKTSTHSLTAQLQPLLRQLRRREGNQDTSPETVSAVSPIIKRENLPDRKSSLPTRAPKMISPSPEKFHSMTSLDALWTLAHDSTSTGLQDLAAQRASLYDLLRRCLGSLGARYGHWKGSWTAFASCNLDDDEMDEIPLGSDEDTAQTRTKTNLQPLKGLTFDGLQEKTLLFALVSERSFYRAYEVCSPVHSIEPSG